MQLPFIYNRMGRCWRCMGCKHSESNEDHECLYVCKLGLDMVEDCEKYLPLIWEFIVGDEGMSIELESEI